MELSTPNEALSLAALVFERAVLQTEQSAIRCALNQMALQVAQHKTKLSLTQYQQVRNQLLQDLTHANHTL